MKINKWLVVAVLAVVLIGGVYGGLSYVENRVVAAVRDTIGKMDNASVGSVSFSLPDRKLVITDVAVQLLQDSLFAHSAKIKSVEAVLPWSMILSSEPKAGVFVIDTVNTQGIEYTTRDGTISIARDRARDVHIDLATLEQFLFKKEAEAADMLARYERNNLGRAESEGIVLSVLGEGVRLEIANSVVERMNGLRIGSLRSTGIAVFVAEPQAVPEKVLEVASFSMGNVDLPVDALRLALELQTPPSHEQLDAWMRSLFAGKEPLVGRFTVRDCKLAENIFPVSFRSFDMDWSSAAPLRYTATLESLTVPAQAIGQMLGWQLPNLHTVEVSMRTEEKEDDDAAGGISVHDVYSVKNMFDFDARARFVVTDVGRPSAQSMPIWWKTGRMHDMALAGLDMKLEDKNLMAYVLLNLEGPEATGDILLGLLSLMPGANTEAYKNMMGSLAPFIKRPGTLSVSFAPQSPVPFPQFLEMLYDPWAILTVNGTPGAVSVRDMIKKIQEPAGK